MPRKSNKRYTLTCNPYLHAVSNTHSVQVVKSTYHPTLVDFIPTIQPLLIHHPGAAGLINTGENNNQLTIHRW